MKMLVALDQSPYAVTVLEKAIALAKLEGATLSIMTVAEDFMDLGDYLDVNSITDKVFATTKTAAQDYGKVARTPASTPKSSWNRASLRPISSSPMPKTRAST